MRIIEQTLCRVNFPCKPATVWLVCLFVAPERCSAHQYTCNSGSCIDRSLLCNRVYDCDDGTDEFNCREYFHWIHIVNYYMAVMMAPMNSIVVSTFTEFTFSVIIWLWWWHQWIQLSWVLSLSSHSQLLYDCDDSTDELTCREYIHVRYNRVRSLSHTLPAVHLCTVQHCSFSESVHRLWACSTDGGRQCHVISKVPWCITM